MSNIVPFEHQLKLAQAFAQSNLFGIKNEAQALALMALCEAEGLHPAKAVQEYHIVQGRPAMKADAMLARFQKAGGKVEWHTYTDKEVTGTFSHPQGGSVKISWTFDEAKKIGLTSKDNWKNYPRAMLRARCISEGVRTVYPGIATGTYTVEEAQDMDPESPPMERAQVKMPKAAEPAAPEAVQASTPPATVIDNDTGEITSESVIGVGEFVWANKKKRAHEIPDEAWQKMLERLGIAELQKATVSQFAALRAELGRL